MASLDEVIVPLRALLEETQSRQTEKQREFDVVQARAIALQTEVTDLNMDVSCLRRALESLEYRPGVIGRPTGSGSPHGVLEQVKLLLPQRSRWTGAELRAALTAKGIPVAPNRVSAVLSRLREQGKAIRVAKGQWAAA